MGAITQGEEERAAAVAVDPYDSVKLKSETRLQPAKLLSANCFWCSLQTSIAVSSCEMSTDLVKRVRCGQDENGGYACLLQGVLTDCRMHYTTPLLTWTIMNQHRQRFKSQEFVPTGSSCAFTAS